MLSSRHIRHLPPNLLLAIHQQLNTVPRPRLVQPISFVSQPRRTYTSSLLSRVGISTREEKFRHHLDQAIEHARNPQTWNSFPEVYNRLLSQYRQLGDARKPAPGRQTEASTNMSIPSSKISSLANGVFPSHRSITILWFAAGHKTRTLKEQRRPSWNA